MHTASDCPVFIVCFVNNKEFTGNIKNFFRIKSFLPTVSAAEVKKDILPEKLLKLQAMRILMNFFPRWLIIPRCMRKAVLDGLLKSSLTEVKLFMNMVKNLKNFAVK